MAKCECCGEREANAYLSGDAPESAGLEDAKYAYGCMFELSLGPLCDHIRARRAKAEQSRDTIPAPPPAAPECRECSRPERPIAATHGDLCVYCEHKQDDGIFTDGATEQRNADARARLAAADRKAQPRATAESRMLALPHPWECGGEDEP